MAKVTMPQLGESVAEGTIGKWLKQPGDSVEKYEPLLEVITDKVNAEVPSPFAGVLKEILVEEGATVPNNAEIAVIETADEGSGAAETTATPEPALEAPKAEAQPASRRGSPRQPPPRPPPQHPRRPHRARSPPTAPPAPTSARSAAASAAPAAPTAVATEPAGNADARMTPAVRRLLREHGLTPAQIVGTGGGGRITREDVTNFVESQRTGQPVGGQSATAVSAPAPATAAPGTAATPPAAPAPGAGHAAPGGPRPAPPAPARARPPRRRSSSRPAPMRSSSRRPRCARASPPR